MRSGELAPVVLCRLARSTVLPAALLSLIVSFAYSDDRLPFDAKINNQPVRLAFDTGAQFSVLFRPAADRLGLKIAKVDYKEPLPPGKVPMDVAEECNLDVGLGAGPLKCAFGVVDLPVNVPSDIDGVISWNDARNYIIELDAEKPRWGFLQELPTNLTTWAKWKLVPDPEYLEFECPSPKESAKIGIDTGSSDGVDLGTRRWEKWRAERADKLETLDASIFPADGLIIRQVLRARKMSIGGLDLVDAPVAVVPPSMDVLLGHPDAVLGLHVFRQLKLLIDAKHGALYTKSIPHPTADYAYNRIAAVFTPVDLQKTDDLVAHVVRGGPAYRAGIRDGDVLLKIGMLNVTVWRTDPYILPLSRFWRQPAGTKQKLVLKHNSQLYETTVTLEDPPAVE